MVLECYCSYRAGRSHSSLALFFPLRLWGLPNVAFFGWFRFYYELWIGMNLHSMILWFIVLFNFTWYISSRRPSNKSPQKTPDVFRKGNKFWLIYDHSISVDPLPFLPGLCVNYTMHIWRPVYLEGYSPCAELAAVMLESGLKPHREFGP